MGKGSGGSSTSSGGSEAISYAPVQLGAKTDASTFRPEWFDSAISGLYEMIKGQVMDAYSTFGDMKSWGKELKGQNLKGMQEYEDKASQIADQMMVSFAQNVQPDEVKTFPLDSFIESSIKSVYKKAGDIYNNPTLSRSELKTMIDANTNNLATQFRERRRGIEQEIAARGLSGPAAAEARDSAERDIASARGNLATQTLANEFSQKYNRQLAALGTQQTAIGQAEQQTSALASRWLDQWKNKLTAEGLRQSGLQLQLSANQQAAGLEQQQFSNNWNMMNYPMQALSFGSQFLGGVNQQAIDEYRASVAAYGGAGSSSSWNTSEGTQWGNNGSYGLPFGIWQQNY